MISRSSDWIDLLRGLNAASVKYLIIGAHALSAYGVLRTTGDLDIWIDRTPENARAAFNALADFGAPLGDLKPSDFEADDRIFMFGKQPLRVDVLTDIDGVGFHEAWPSRVNGQLLGVPVSYIGREHLVRNKRAVGRPKDLADLDALDKI